jgi:hypothetical protein
MHSLAYCSQLFFLSIAIIAAACSHNPRAALAPVARASEEQPCAPPLTNDQILGVVREALRIDGADATNLERDFRITITPDKCDYFVLGKLIHETIPVQFSIRVSRTGEVKSWPWCCIPGYQLPKIVGAQVDEKPPIK